MAGHQVLAIENAEFANATGLRKNEDLIDSLSYVEGFTPDARKSAEALIKKEMTRMGKKPADYLHELPKLHQVRFTGHPLLQGEYERVKAQTAMAQPDQERLKCLPPPDNRKNDVSAWQSSLDNAHSQLEHQYNRLLNLELLLEHGTKAWQAHIRSLELASKRMEETTKFLKMETDEVNATRKLKHVAAGKQLKEMHKEWTSLIEKNVEIAKANAKLDQEIAALREKLPESERLEAILQQDEEMGEDMIVTEDNS